VASGRGSLGECVTSTLEPVESLRCDPFGCGEHFVLCLEAESPTIWFADLSVPGVLLREFLLPPVQPVPAGTQLAFEAVKLGLATCELLSRLLMHLFRVPNRSLAAAYIFLKRVPSRWPRRGAGRRSARRGLGRIVGSLGHRSRRIGSGWRRLGVLHKSRRTPPGEDDESVVTPAASHCAARDSVGLPAVRAAFDPR
jgi:hypothetical protein